MTLSKEITCDNCLASCCRLEVMLIDDPAVPEHLVDADPRGGQRMLRLDDGWCAALDRNTMRCTIYTRRPQICRDFLMAGPDCVQVRAEPIVWK